MRKHPTRAKYHLPANRENLNWLKLERPACSKLILVLFASVVYTFLVLPATNLPASSRAIAAPDIEQLIDQLDHNDFRKRESAQLQIVAVGDAAIVPLVQKLAFCSPETSSRVKRALYRIAANCNEDNLFKVLAILKVRFDISDQQVQPLLTRWATTGRKAIIQRWRDSGATVVDPHQQMVAEGFGAGQPMVPGMRPMVFNGVRAFRGGQPMEFKVAPSEDLRGQAAKAADNPKEDRAAATPPPLETGSMAERIESVLANSTEQNMENVLGDDEGGQGFKSAVALVQSFPVEVSIDGNWQGKVGDFSRRSDIRTLPISKIELDSLSLDSRWANVLRWHPLESITISNCSLSGDVKSDSPLLPPSVSSVTVKKSDNAGELISQLVRETSKVYRVGLVDCSLDSKAFKLLSDLNIMSLELEDMELGEGEFDRLEAMPKLRQLSLNRCRFSAKEFRAFETALQGRVQLDFTAKAFLGVRGNTAPIMFGPNMELNQQVGNVRNGSGCVITEVVPGAAADDAGVKAGDVVLSLGKQEVVDFSDLRVLIAQYGIGDEIVIRVRRNEKEIELKMTLGDFKDANN